MQALYLEGRKIPLMSMVGSAFFRGGLFFPEDSSPKLHACRATEFQSLAEVLIGHQRNRPQAQVYVLKRGFLGNTPTRLVVVATRIRLPSPCTAILDCWLPPRPRNDVENYFGLYITLVPGFRPFREVGEDCLEFRESPCPKHG